MGMVRKQHLFLIDVMLLLDFISSKGLGVTFGEASRPIEMQEIYVKIGRSKTMNSDHLRRMAIDLNFFKVIDGVYKYICNKADIQEIGDYWESLNDKNTWGGNWNSFKDVPHFGRRL